MNKGFNKPTYLTLVSDQVFYPQRDKYVPQQVVQANHQRAVEARQNETQQAPRKPGRPFKNIQQTTVLLDTNTTREDEGETTI